MKKIACVMTLLLGLASAAHADWKKIDKKGPSLASARAICKKLVDAGGAPSPTIIIPVPFGFFGNSISSSVRRHEQKRACIKSFGWEEKRQRAGKFDMRPNGEE